MTYTINHEDLPNWTFPDLPRSTYQFEQWTDGLPNFVASSRVFLLPTIKFPDPRSYFRTCTTSLSDNANRILQSIILHLLYYSSLVSSLSQGPEEPPFNPKPVSVSLSSTLFLPIFYFFLSTRLGGPSSSSEGRNVTPMRVPLRVLTPNYPTNAHPSTDPSFPLSTMFPSSLCQTFIQGPVLQDLNLSRLYHHSPTGIVFYQSCPGAHRTSTLCVRTAVTA